MSLLKIYKIVTVILLILLSGISGLWYANNEYLNGYLNLGSSLQTPAAYRDPVNSSTNTLADGATFTGSSTRHRGKDVLVTLKTDAPGTLFMEFSQDNTNWDSSLSFNVRSDFNEIHQLVKGDRYYRTRFTDDSDGTTQTYFRLQTEYGDFDKLTSPNNGTISDDQDALVVRALPGFFDIARGKVQGVTTINKFGESQLGVQSTATDIWDGATSTPTRQIWLAPTSAQTHTVTSSDTGDTAAGGGARTVRLYGLTSWDSLPTTEDVTMNGTTGTTTTKSFVCINRMEVLTSGGSTNDSNIGVITARADTDGTPTAIIRAGEGKTLMAIYCLSSLQTAYMTQYYGSLNKASGAVATVDFRIRFNPEPDATTTPFRTENIRGVQSTGTSDTVWPFGPFKQFVGPGIIKIQGTGSTDDLEASAGFGLIIEEN